MSEMGTLHFKIITKLYQPTASLLCLFFTDTTSQETYIKMIAVNT